MGAVAMKKSVARTKNELLERCMDMKKAQPKS
jgi:hypothetical protein